MASLSDVYLEIRHQCVEDAMLWPRAETMQGIFARDEGGLVKSPIWEDGKGPVGLYAKLSISSEHVNILRKCRLTFEDFLAQLSHNMLCELRDEFKRSCYLCPEPTWHMCVLIYHENPDLISESERMHWQHIDPEMADALASGVRKCTESLRAPTLTLDSLSICSDGALIAGFVDDAHGCFSTLRSVARDAGREILNGELTSRPKRLMHVTLGRVLALPPLSFAERAACTRTLLKFNNETLPEVARSISTKLVISSVSLGRDNSFGLVKFDEMSTWSLQLPGG